MATGTPPSSTAGLPRAPSASRGPATAPDPPVRFRFVPHYQDSRLTAEWAGEAAIIRIFSDGGIGSADVAIVSEKLPQNIILQFHLHGLERLRFAYNQTTVQVSLPSGEDGYPFEAVTRDGKAALSGPITPDSPYWMKVRLVPSDALPVAIPLKEGYIEVEIPPSFLAEQNHRFSIQWIDFYR